MSVALLVITNGRPGLLAKTLRSAKRYLRGGQIEDAVIVDDTPGLGHSRPDFSRHFADFDCVVRTGGRGFAAAIAAGWVALLERRGDRHDADETYPSFVFHLEDDFVFECAVPLDTMQRVLLAKPSLVQLALRRQAVNADERAAGGVIEQHPEAYTTHVLDGAVWLEHRLFFTTNPSLYRISLCERGWPNVPKSEGLFTHTLLAEQPEARFGYWGPKEAAPMVTHIGEQRTGTGY